MARQRYMTAREERLYYKSIGICYLCHRNKLFGDEKICPECLASRAAYQASRKTERHEAYEKRKAELKENSLCVRCGKVPVTKYKQCEDCRTKNKKYRLKRSLSEKLPREEWSAYGLCVRCGKDLDRDGKICSVCYTKSVKALEKGRQAQEVNPWVNAVRSYWKAKKGVANA